MNGNMEILNSKDHSHIGMAKIAEEHPHFVNIILNEVPVAASCCPIFFVKNSETGYFSIGALFGFKAGEVLVEGSQDGNAVFVPLNVQRQGFFAADDNIAIDPSHPRFNGSGTISLFDDAGQPSEEMQKIQKAIGMLMAGQAPTDVFIQEMLRLRLMERVDISLKFDDGEKLVLDGLYSISFDMLNELGDAEIVKLFRSGYLQAALCMRNSLQQIALLARRRNERLAGPY